MANKIKPCIDRPKHAWTHIGNLVLAYVAEKLLPPAQPYAWLYVNKQTGEEKVSVNPWKRDGSEKWPRNWDEFPLVKGAV